MAHTVNGSSESSGESLNGSWVKLEGSSRNGNNLVHSPVGSEDGAMEDLIAEAVADHSKQSSSAEKSPSPQSERSPTHERPRDRLRNLPAQEGNTDWIWDWSSRVEAQPPKQWKLRHPTKKSQGSTLSIRRTRVMKSEVVKTYFYIIIPSLVVSHLIAFGIGVYVGRKTVDINTS